MYLLNENSSVGASRVAVVGLTGQYRILHGLRHTITHELRWKSESPPDVLPKENHGLPLMPRSTIS